MKKLMLALLFVLPFHLYAQNEYDVVVVGATPGGIMAAVSAAREGHNVLLLERTWHVGGLPANGLGATDISTRGVTTGLFMEFVNRNLAFYEQQYGKHSAQYKDCSDGYHFEPSVAEQTFLGMIEEQGEKIKVLYGRQFDSNPSNVMMENGVIKAIKITDRNNGEKEIWKGKVFIDATYEGDLGAATGLPYRIGREGRDEFGEVCAGKVYRYWDVQNEYESHFAGYYGHESEGTTYKGDNAVQAYNYRLCLTTDVSRLKPIEKPAKYDRNEYISLVDDVLSGRNTHYFNRNGEAVVVNMGIAKITNMVILPNSKTDANNQHLAFISTDLPEENWPWPSASWEWRDRFAERLKNYTLGLLWFAQNDPDLPESFRKECLRWGLASDEYKDNDNFPRQVYVREGRRFEGNYFFTASDVIPVSEGQRPPIHTNSITSSHYSLDSHAVLKREKDRVHLDGFFSFRTKPYTVPYGVIVSDKVDNLIFPVPVSGSHVGFSTLRMEPCWMALGQAAGTAASIAIDKGLPVHGVDVAAIQKILVSQGATLIYFEDCPAGSADFEMVQYMGLHGYLKNWTADLDKEATAEEKRAWENLSGQKIPSKLKTKGDILRHIYNSI